MIVFSNIEVINVSLLNSKKFRRMKNGVALDIYEDLEQ